VRSETLASRRRLYLLARVVVARHYRERLTLASVAVALSSSPRQLQRAYAQFGEISFSEDLTGRRMAAAAELLIEQRSIPVASVARLVGYRQAPHFARAFHRRFGVPPALFRERAQPTRASSYGPVSVGAAEPAPTGSERARSEETSSDAAGSSLADSAPGRHRRISVPPPGALRATTVPPC